MPWRTVCCAAVHGPLFPGHQDRPDGAGDAPRLHHAATASPCGSASCSSDPGQQQDARDRRADGPVGQAPRPGQGGPEVRGAAPGGPALPGQRPGAAAHGEPGLSCAGTRPGCRSPTEAKHRIGYFASCGLSFEFPEVVAATLRVLARNGCAVTIMDNTCCGRPAHSYGDLDTARDIARKNLDRMAEEAKGLEAVVSDCGSCSTHLKEYGELLKDDPAYREKAAAFAAKVRSFSEFLAAVGLDASWAPSRDRHLPRPLPPLQPLRQDDRPAAEAAQGGPGPGLPGASRSRLVLRGGREATPSCTTRRPRGSWTGR